MHGRVVIAAGWLWVLALFAAPRLISGESREIPNPLGQDWPWELVHWDLPADKAAGVKSVLVGGQARPVQREELAGGTVRLWFIATVPQPPRGKKATVPKHVVTLSNEDAPSTLQLTESGTAIQIANGVHTLRLPRYAGAQNPPLALTALPGPFGGFKLPTTGDFFGRSAFDGSATVSSAVTDVLERGPVFVRVRQRLTFPGGGFYEAVWRVVAGDPWVDVTERYELPENASYTIEVRDVLKPTTVMWVRWFGYDGFGGNVDLNFHPLRPQEKQRGPFVALRPRWSQMPGGGMDFFVTRGGESPYRDRKSGKTVTPEGYDPEHPAFGVVATYPMNWTEPYAQTIAAYAENGDTARLKLPLKKGSRSYALVAGARGLFDSTGKLNDLVRRHTDWTLNREWNEYVLEWPRDPEKAGPHIFITRARLQKLRADLAAKKETPETRLIREFEARRETLKGKDKALLELLLGEPVKAPVPLGAQLWLDRRYQDDMFNPTGFTRKIKDGFPLADLFADGQPLGGPWQAALGYIFSDLNQWPGYENGWGPGNPNFHTDKYSVAVNAAAALADHPHAPRWLEFGRKNFDEDVKKVLLEPDGVGYECPGYSTYSLEMQLELARTFVNTGHANPVASNPLFKKTGIWHRHLLTPFDARIGIRHQAPVGDTHRWGANDGEMFGALAAFYKQSDPAFASEMMGVREMFVRQGMRGSLFSELVDLDLSIEPLPLEKMEWGSHAFFGFGSVMRSRFGTAKETFVSFKAGPARGHYHNDELSYHFYGAGSPLSLDYNCSYHPRGDHAALHNSMTFGQQRPFKHTGDEQAVAAMEQMGGVARVGVFNRTAAADIVSAERTSDRLTLTPVEPDDAKFQYPYPQRSVKPLTHRRTLALVKHPAGSPVNDYLVVRDETLSNEAQQLNIHLLARAVERSGALLRADGQFDADASIFLAGAAPLKIEELSWHYFDEYMNGPGEWKKNTPESEAKNAAWLKQIRDSKGTALIPPPGFSGAWQVGEYQKWMRIHTAPGQPMLWVLYPRKKGEPEPVFEALADGRGVRVKLGEASDEVFVSSNWPAETERPGDAWIVQNGATTVLIAKGALPPLGAFEERIPQRNEALPDDAAPER